MIDRYTFCTLMKWFKDKYYANDVWLDEIYNQSYDVDVVIQHNYMDLLIEILEKATRCYKDEYGYSIIKWWCLENGFGKKKQEWKVEQRRFVPYNEDQLFSLICFEKKYLKKIKNIKAH